MARPTRFAIRNGEDTPFIINLEPHCHFIHLEAGEELTIIDSSEDHPVSIVVSKTEEHGTILSLWPGDGDLRIEKDGHEIDKHGE